MFLSSDNSGYMVDVTMMLSSQRLFQPHRKIPGSWPTKFFLSAAFPAPQENPWTQRNIFFPLSGFSSSTGKSLAPDQQNFSSQRLFQLHRKIPEVYTTSFSPLLTSTAPVSPRYTPNSGFSSLTGPNPTSFLSAAFTCSLQGGLHFSCLKQVRRKL